MIALNHILSEQAQAAEALRSGQHPTFLVRLWASDLMAEEVLIRAEYAMARAAGGGA